MNIPCRWLTACRRLLGCGSLTLLGWACSSETIVYDDRYVPVDLYEDARIEAVAHVSVTAASAEAVVLSWQKHSSELLRDYRVAQTYLGAGQSAAPMLPARVTLPDQGWQSQWFATETTTLTLALAQAGAWSFQVFAAFPDGSLSAGSTAVTWMVSAAANSTTGDTPTPSDNEHPSEAAEPCLTPAQLLSELNGYLCFDLKHSADPGPDLLWATNDDIVQSRSLYAVTETSDLVLYPGVYGGFGRVAFVFDHVGDDGEWRTDDDYLSSFSDARAPASATSASVRAYALDNTWCIRQNTDLNGYERLLRPAPQAATGTVYYHNGADAIWQTDDDAVRRWLAYAFAGDRVTQVVSYSLPGDDFNWFSGDDWAGGHERLFYDAADAISAVNIYGRPGSDGVFGTTDDLNTLTYFYNRSAPGAKLDAVHFYERNAVSELTAPVAAVRYEYTSNLLTRLTTYSPGTDNVLGTSDDVTTATSAVQTTSCPAP